MSEHDPVWRMVRTERGTASRIAEACGINREAVWNWHQVPARHVLNVERVTGIPRDLIRPDLKELWAPLKGTGAMAPRQIAFEVSVPETVVWEVVRFLEDHGVQISATWTYRSGKPLPPELDGALPHPTSLAPSPSANGRARAAILASLAQGNGPVTTKSVLAGPTGEDKVLTPELLSHTFYLLTKEGVIKRLRRGTYVKAEDGDGCEDNNPLS